MRNIELKARLHNRDYALEVCRRIGAEPQGDIRQVDTYFRVPEGRFKLRECDPGDDYLVFYRRPDIAAVKGCDYLTESANPTLKALLLEALESLGTIRKTRSLWLWENVRVHLDEVTGLGAFIEFEAVLSEQQSDDDGIEKLAHLRNVFKIGDRDLQKGSYFDLLYGAR